MCQKLSKKIFIVKLFGIKRINKEEFSLSNCVVNGDYDKCFKINGLIIFVVIKLEV